MSRRLTTNHLMGSDDSLEACPLAHEVQVPKFGITVLFKQFQYIDLLFYSYVTSKVFFLIMTYFTFICDRTYE